MGIETPSWRPSSDAESNAQSAERSEKPDTVDALAELKKSVETPDTVTSPEQASEKLSDEMFTAWKDQEDARHAAKMARLDAMLDAIKNGNTRDTTLSA